MLELENQPLQCGMDGMLQELPVVGPQPQHSYVLNMCVASSIQERAPHAACATHPPAYQGSLAETNVAETRMANPQCNGCKMHTCIAYKCTAVFFTCIPIALHSGVGPFGTIRRHRGHKAAWQIGHRPLAVIKYEIHASCVTIWEVSSPKSTLCRGQAVHTPRITPRSVNTTGKRAQLAIFHDKHRHDITPFPMVLCVRV